MKSEKSSWWWRGSALVLLLTTSGCVTQPARVSPLTDDILQHEAPPRVVAWNPPPAVEYAPPVGVNLPDAIHRPRVIERVEPAPTVMDAPRAPSVEPVPALEFDVVLAGQAALDRMNFSPGCLDGRMGGKTRQALRAWRESEGRNWDGQTDEAVLRELARGQQGLKSITLREQDVSQLTSVPSDWPARARLPHLNHETVLERLAERYHATEGLIRELNPAAAWPNPPTGTSLRVPKIPRGRSPRLARIEVHQEQRVVRGYDASGKLVVYFPCSIAANYANRPSGQTTVKNQAADPTYTFDPKIFPELSEAQKGTRRLVIPAGPNNPVGIAWVGLNLPGYGIHGTPKPERIGNAESHGCIRLANWNALKLAHMVRAGVPVSFVE